MTRSRGPMLPVFAVLLLAGSALADGFHSPLLRNPDPRKWAQTIREQLHLDRSDSAEETRVSGAVDAQTARQLVNVLKYLQKRNVLLREFPEFNYDNIPGFKSETESILIAMGGDAVPVLLDALVSDLTAIQTVTGLARNADFIARVKHILVAIGEEAVDGIVARLPTVSGGAERALLEVLGAIVVDPDFGSDAEAWLRWHLLWSAGRHRDQGKVPALIEALKDPDRRLRIAAARSLGSIRSRTAVPDLVALLGDPGDRPQFRETLRSLARIGDLQAVPAILALLEHPTHEIRQEAATALRFLTHKMMGYDARARPEDRAAAVDRWRRWWEAQRR